MWGIATYYSRQAPAPVLAVTELEPYRYRSDDGSKFPGGFGETQLLRADYWTLRARSSQLFETNLYARGLVRRLVTNEINTGLHLEATPEEALLGLEEDSLADWSENVENRFKLWESDARLCDQGERLTFGGIQALARMEALIAGDVLVVMRQDQRTKLPRIQLINGARVQTPFGYTFDPKAETQIRHGVEIDSTGRHVAFHVRQDDGLTTKRLPAFGEKSGRRLAWLVYGTEKRLDDVRGKPLLSLVLQSLREIDRYRDSVQRKAVVNAILAGFIKKTQAGPASFGFGSGAVKRGVAVDGQGEDQRTLKFQEQIPGLFIEELAYGEEPVFTQSHGTDEKFGDFEEAIIQAIAWAHEIPPEILRLAFSSNYSASQAAINEFKTYLNKVRTAFGEQFCQPVYVEWLLAETLNKKFEAPRLLDSWRDPTLYDVFGAWISADWSGNIKPAVDLSKLVGGYEKMLDRGLITYDRASRELTGTKWSKNVQKIAREVKQLAAALAPLKALEALTKPAPVQRPPADDGESSDERDPDQDDEDERNAA